MKYLSIMTRSLSCHFQQNLKCPVEFSRKQTKVIFTFSPSSKCIVCILEVCLNDAGGFVGGCYFRYCWENEMIQEVQFE